MNYCYSGSKTYNGRLKTAVSVMENRTLTVMKYSTLSTPPSTGLSIIQCPISANCIYIHVDDHEIPEGTNI